METKGPNDCLAGKEKILKHKLFSKIEPFSYTQPTVTITTKCGVSDLCPVQ